MKTWGSWAKALKLTGVTVVVCALLLLAASRETGKRSPQAEAGLSPIATSKAPSVSASKDDPKWIGAYGKLPLSFEENVGQTAQDVRFVSHGSGYELFLTPQGAVLALLPNVSDDLSPLHRTATMRALRAVRRAGQLTAIRVRLEGANPNPPISGTDRLPTRVDYFIGNDPKKWHTDVPSYARVKYTEVYPGVDLVFYGNQRQLEYDFVVSPGADPKAIALRVDGARKMRINSRGDLVLSVSSGEVEFQKPVVYQNIKGQRHRVAGEYAIGKNHRVTFSVASYDRSEPLILDPPLKLNYSTYLGGSATDSGAGIAVDSQGNSYIVGDTKSTDFPGASGSISAANANGAVFVTKINPTGTQQLYSSYLAGTGTFGEFGLGIGLDPTGNIYVTGQTFSTDFPTTSNALKSGTNAGAANGTSFISKINPGVTGLSSLVYSSYLGGTAVSFSGDFGSAIAADASGNAYVTGYTASLPGTTMANFPVTSANAYQTTLASSFGNAFLTKIDTTKSGAASLIYSTYLGGSGANAATPGFAEQAFGVAADSAGNAYLVGTTTSTDFPSKNGYQVVAPAAVAGGTVFVSRIDTTKAGTSSLIYSTYLGGNISEFGRAIALGPSPTTIAYVTGGTNSAAFPTFPAGAYQVCSASGSAFISLIDTGLSGSSSLKYSTCLGAGGTTGFGIRADAAGNAYVGGGTNSSTFPVTSDAFQSAFAAGAAGEGFFSKLNPAGKNAQDLLYSTFFGGIGGGASKPDAVHAIAIDASNNAYLTGVTFSPPSSFPVSPGAFQSTLKGASDAFAASLASDFTVTAPATATGTIGTPVNITVTVTPMGGFSSAVALTCTEPSALTLSTCTPSPASVTPNGGPVTSQVMVTTTAAMVPPTRIPTPPVPWRQIVPLVLAILLLFLLPKTQRLRTRLGMVTAMIVFIILAGCSGAPKPHTIPGTYNLTITGTSGTSVHTATVALTVN